MKLQPIFTAVIEAGLYTEKAGLMCYSLHQATHDGVITTLERDHAKHAIKGYLSGFGSLGGFLAYKQNSYDFQTRLDIYKDWVNRPFQKEVK